jgi:hypothetical protein
MKTCHMSDIIESYVSPEVALVDICPEQVLCASVELSSDSGATWSYGESASW